MGRLSALTPWTEAEEITFECEPGTLTEGKLSRHPQHRRHPAQPGCRELRRPHPRAQRPRPSLARDLPRLRRRALPRLPADQHRPHRGHAGGDRRELADLRREDPGPRSRQRDHLPDGAALQHHDQPRPPEGDRRSSRTRWRTGPPSGAGSRRPSRPWRRAGYHVGSAYTAVKDPAETRFVYRDRLWQGADLVGLGVASFGHVNGVHMQNLDTWETYGAAVKRGEIPLEPRLPAHRRGADDPRARAAAEAGVDPARLLPGEVRSATSSTASASRSPRSAHDGYLPAADEDAGRPVARGPAPRRRAASRASSCPSTRASATPRETRGRRRTPRGLGHAFRHAKSDPSRSGARAWSAVARPRLEEGRPLPARRGLRPGRRRAAPARRVVEARRHPASLPLAAGPRARHDSHPRGPLRRTGRPARALDLLEGPLVLPPGAARAGVLGPAGRDGSHPHRHRRVRSRSCGTILRNQVPLGRAPARRRRRLPQPARAFSRSRPTPR